MEQGSPVMPSAQSGQSAQLAINELSFLSDPCELRLGPLRSPPPAPVNDQASSSRAPRTPFIDSDSDQQTRRTQTQTVTPLGLDPGHPDPCELSLVYQPMLDHTDPCELSLAYLPKLDQINPLELRVDPPGSSLPGPVDVEVSDENGDLNILSPTSFRQAISSRRTRRTPITDVESGETSARNQRRRLDLDPQPSHMSFEGTSSSMLHVEPVAPPPPTYTCQFCLGPMDEEATTRSGNLFCDGCIKSAISAQVKCPMCRRRISHRGLERNFFPAPV